MSLITMRMGMLLLLLLLFTYTSYNGFDVGKGWSWVSFATGVLTAYVVTTVPKILVQFSSASRSQGGESSSIYGLEHGVLNLQVPPAMWWMNMGYWKGQQNATDLAMACHALLSKVLTTAGIDSIHEGSERQRSPPAVNVLDVGFGCGDQTRAICTLRNVISYVGITLDARQFQFANRRYSEKTNVLPDVSATAVKAQLFQADAANPARWSAELRQAVRHFAENDSARHEGAENWLVALDTLYHFRPSRIALFQYANQHMRASIAAFDLLLSERPLGLIQKLLLRAACLAASTPYSNLLTRAQYRKQLLSVGYEAEDIEIVDISEHVFAPLVEFLTYQDQQLKIVGAGIGKFKAAKSLFGWWARTGIVRGCIVIARRKA